MQDVDEYNLREQLGLVLLLVKILGVVSVGDLLDLLNDSIFKIRSFNKLHDLLEVLLHFDQVSQVGDHYYVCINDKQFPIRTSATGGNETNLS